MRWSLKKSLLITTGFLIGTTCVFAQVNSGALAGRICDAENHPIASARVVVSSTKSLYPRLAEVTRGGFYNLPNLPPGADYVVEVSAEGFNRVKRTGVLVTIGTTSTLNVILGREAAPVLVVARAPELSLKQATVTKSIGQREIELLPLDRTYQSTFLLFPMVVPSGLAGNPAVAGATGGENLYFVNATNITDPVMGTTGSNLNFNFVREVQATLGGTDADLMSSTGGSFNVLTKAGSNEFHGEVFAYGTGSGLSARAASTDQATLAADSYTAYDYGFDVSGPLAKNRAWFFLGYNPNYYSRSVSGAYEATNVNSQSGALGTVALFPFDSDQRIYDDYWSLKITARPSDKHAFELSVFGDPSRRYLDEGYALSVSPDAAKTKRYQGGFSGVLQWTALWTASFYSEAMIARTQTKIDLLPWSSASYSHVQMLSYDWSPAVNVGDGMGVYTSDERTTLQAGLKLTWLAGQHEVSGGGRWQGLEWQNTTGFTGGALWYVQGGTGAPLSSKPKDYANWFILSQQNPFSHETGRYSALFIQDRWSLRDNLILTAGLRWDEDQVFPERGMPLNLSSLSPRIGIAWDFTGKGRGKLFAHWGQYSERVPILMAQSMDAGHAYYTDIWTDHGQQHLGTFVSGNVPTTVAPGTKNPYDEEWELGASYQASPDLTLNFTAVFRQLGRALEDVVYPDANGNLNALIMNPGTGPWPSQMAGWASQIPDYEPFPKPIRNYQGYTVQALKRFGDRWFLNASYTWSRLVGNYEGGSGGYGTDGYAPFVSSAYDYPRAIYSRNRYGYLPQDRTNQVQVQAGYQWENGFSAGAVFEYLSGRPISQTMSFPLMEPGGGVLFASPRGSAGRLPGIWHLDLHAQFAIPIRRTSLAFIADIFNATNRQAATAVQENYYLPPMTTQDILTGNLHRDPRWDEVTARQPGRSVRLGVKWSF